MRAILICFQNYFPKRAPKIRATWFQSLKYQPEILYTSLSCCGDNIGQIGESNSLAYSITFHNIQNRPTRNRVGEDRRKVFVCTKMAVRFLECPPRRVSAKFDRCCPQLSERLINIFSTPSRNESLIISSPIASSTPHVKA